MTLQYFLSEGLWIIHFRVIQETPLRTAAWVLNRPPNNQHHIRTYNATGKNVGIIVADEKQPVPYLALFS
jgi:hypothetical protein